MRPNSDIANMINKLQWHVAQNRLLLVALVFSLLLHTFLLSNFSFSLPVQDEDQHTLEMRLVNLPPAKIMPLPETKAETVPKKTVSPAQPIPSLEENVAPSKESDASLPPTVNEAPAKSTAESDYKAEMPEEPAGPVSDREIEQPVDKQRLYRYVETEFDVRRGQDSSAAGQAKITFQINEDNTYKLTSTTEAVGLASLFFGRLVQKSEGLVTDHGLKPSQFSYQYDAKKDKDQIAYFAWTDGIIELHTAKGKKIEPLADNAQDLLSFMYQFMFEPPLTNMQLNITNGKHLRTYHYSFEGEELIKTKMGEINTIHLLKQDDNEEKTEIWLATEYQYLPVKIRKTEKNGSVIEQTIRNIKTEQP